MIQMQSNMRPYPVLRLNDAITEAMSKVKSIDIPGGITTGLDPEIHPYPGDEYGPISEIADIDKRPTDGMHYVSLSPAYAQLVWLLCDIAFRIHESVAIQAEFEQFGDKEKEQFLSHLNDSNEVSRYIQELINWEAVLRYCADSTNRIIALFNERTSETEMNELYGYDMTSGIGTRVNAIYTYGMTFILLHEFSHHRLGHDIQTDGSVAEEMEADQSAFWSMYSDLEDKEKRTAMRGILCALVSLLFLNRNLEDDGVHQRPVERIFTYYDLLQSEEEDYAPLLCYLLYAWAVFAGDDDMPKLYENKNYTEALEKMEAHLMELEKRQDMKAV